MDYRGHTTQYVYNPLTGDLISVQQGAAVTGVTYDRLGQAERLTDPAGNITSFQYDALRRLTQISSLGATPPKITSVVLNSRLHRGISSIDPSGSGVRTVQVAFNKTVDFNAEDVLVQAVELLDGVEAAVETLVPTEITGQGTNILSIVLGSASPVDTWVRVTLKGNTTLVDKAGRLLDGEAPASGSGRGYIYDGTEDLPTGDGTPGGDAVFYVGSLRGDFNGDLAVGPEDLQGFRDAWLAKSLDADFRGVGFGPRPPDGRVTLGDIDGFTTAYQRGIAQNMHLYPLPVPGAGLAAAVTPLSLLPSVLLEADILAEAAGLLPLNQRALLVASRTQDTHSDQNDADPLDMLRVRRTRPVAASSGSAALRLQREWNMARHSPVLPVA
jgi:YD repeat-containing protein